MPDALRLFLIEDDDDMALLIRKSLERAGHAVSRCRTAADALIVLGQVFFDLVLLDQCLPDMSGVELLQALARERIHVPALMVTGHGDERLATQVLRAGALDYIVKDPSLTFLAELPKRVTEAITRHRLQHANRLLVEAIESARDGVMITDLQGTILHVNQALEAMTGYTRQELLGQGARLLKSGVHPPELYAGMWRAISARESWQGELTNRRKDNSLVEISLTVSPIVNNQGQLTHFVGIQRDITERKQLERQLLQAQKMHSVGTLAGGVAHEFNNLLAGINGYASLGLREPGLSAPIREFLENIANLSERAAALTRQLLAFARKPALERKPAALADLARATAELVRRTLHVEVTLEVQEKASDGRPLQAEADVNQLQQALINLALNARDATEVARTRAGRSGPALETLPPLSILFRVSQKVLPGPRSAFPQSVPAGDYVVLEVADSGSGMMPEVLNQALDPFFTTKEVGQGTGLGLPMVFGIVQAHQGHITIDSTPGQGTRVALYLPRLASSAKRLEKGASATAGRAAEPERVSGKSILVVDDEESVLDVIRRFLEIAGHQVTCVATGKRATELLSSGQEFDLVILDLMMPRDDSKTTLARLRECRPELPILLCTGLPDADPAAQSLAADVAMMIRKPFRMNELWHAIQQVLATHEK